MQNILDHFKLKNEKEKYEIVIENIDKGVSFKGTNLWILVFAIFIASLGLNVNSTAVIIGAMLVSPLMGPIMGLGLGMAINDLDLLKRSIFNYLFAAAVGLVTSTLYFFISPINDAHSEILARTAPNIYDVLIALFGGFAGILATSSKQKGNVIPGVAIATALMPPLCTAGYGLATLKFSFFFGAMYLFMINTVFIALATLITTRFLKFPSKHLLNEKDEKKAKKLVWIIVLITLLPSIYLGYDLVEQNRFNHQANEFIDNEANFPNDYLLKKVIDAKNNEISLTYGGQLITEKEIKNLKSKMRRYKLDSGKLVIKQGFSNLDKNESNNNNILSNAMQEKDEQIKYLVNRLDSLKIQKNLAKQIYNELKIQNPHIVSATIEPTTFTNDTTQFTKLFALLLTNNRIPQNEKNTIENWLKVRLNDSLMIIKFE